MKSKSLIIAFLIIVFQLTSLQSQTVRIKVRPAKSSKYGYVDLSGELIISPEYKNAFDFTEEGSAHVYDGQKKLNPGNLSKSRLIDINGDVIIDISDYDIYDAPWSGLLSGYRDGILRVIKNGKFGALNSKGELIVPIKYKELTDFDNGYAVGKRDKEYYIVKSTGEETLLNYDITYIKRFSEGLAPIEVKGQKFGFIDTLGNMVIEPAFISTGYFSARYTWVRAADNKIGFINTNGEWIAQPQFEAANSFDRESGMALIKEEGEWSYLDTLGNVHYFKSIDKLYGFSEGLAVGREGEFVGYINNKGEYVIPPIYEAANYFKNGYGRVKKDGKWGLIDKEGKWVIEPIFRNIGEVVIIQ